MNSEKIILFKDSGDYSANQVIGVPNVYPMYGDLALTWAPLPESSPMEYIVLKYNTPVYAKQLNVYETLGSGSIIKIEVKNIQNNDWSIVWQSSNSPPQIITSSRIFSPTLIETSFKTQEVRLTSNCSNGLWCEIDAVGKLVLKKSQFIF